MSSLLAIDSGHPDAAIAMCSSGRLVSVATVTLEWVAPIRPFDRVVVEIPTLRGDNTPNPEDLLLVAVVGARLAERAACRTGEVVEYRPREWKASTPKPPHHARMWNALNPKEQALLGGARTTGAISAACARGAQNGWRKPGASYYRASEFPTVNGTKITHDILDAVALALYDMRRIPRG